MEMEPMLRRQLAEFLDWTSAHAGFDAAVKGMPPALRGKVPEGFEHSAWQLVEHIRIAQNDILDFCVNPRYKGKKWPDDYWPTMPRPSNAAAWTKSIARFRRDRRAMQRLATNARVDLLAKIPHGSGQTYLREILLVADHTAHHVGQLIDVRRALGNWKPQR
jgi:uncharacterized damage-inducible protein DinB